MNQGKSALFFNSNRQPPISPISKPPDARRGWISNAMRRMNARGHRPVTLSSRIPDRNSLIKPAPAIGRVRPMRFGIVCASGLILTAISVSAETRVLQSFEGDGFGDWKVVGDAF